MFRGGIRCCATKREEEEDAPLAPKPDPLEPVRSMWRLMEKVLIVLGTLIAFLSAVALIFIVSFAVVDKDFKTSDAVLEKSMSDGGVPLTMAGFGYVSLAVAGLFILLACCGVVGSLQEKKGPVVVYCFAIVLLAAVLITVGVMVHVFLASFGEEMKRDLEDMCAPSAIAAYRNELCARRLEEVLPWDVGPATSDLVEASWHAAAGPSSRPRRLKQVNVVTEACDFQNNDPKFCKHKCHALADLCGVRRMNGTAPVRPRTGPTTTERPFELSKKSVFMKGKVQMVHVAEAILTLGWALLKLMLCLSCLCYELVRKKSLVDLCDCCGLARRYAERKQGEQEERGDAEAAKPAE